MTMAAASPTAAASSASEEVAAAAAAAAGLVAPTPAKNAIHYVAMEKILDRARAYIPELNARVMTLRELAEILGCSACTLSRVLSHQLDRATSTTEKRRNTSKLVESRRFLREKHALLVINRQKSVKKAAADARCSQRTLYRYIRMLNGPQEP